MRAISLGVLGCVSSSLGLAACASDGANEGRPPTASERAAISAVVGRADTIVKLVEDPAEADVIAISDVDPIASLISPMRRGAPRSGVALAPLPGCAATDGTMATFTQCEAGGVTLDGTITKTGDAYAVDLDAVVARTEFSGMVAVNGTVTVNATTVDGTLTASANGMAGGETLSVNAMADFDAIGLDAQGCPTSGRLVVSGSVTQGGPMVTASRAITFGPACGDVLVQ